MVVLIHLLTPYDHCQLPGSTTSVLKTDFPSPFAVCIAWKSGPLKIIALSQEMGRSSTKSYAVRTKCSLWRIILWPMTIKCQELWYAFDICILPYFWICPWPAACYLRRWRRLRRSVKEAGGSRFFFIAEEEVEKATLFVAFFRRALTLIHTYPHIDTHTHTCLLTLARVRFHVQIVKSLR